MAIGILRCGLGELRVGKMTKAMLLGVPLVLGRKKDGKIFAMRDLCPHRGIPLSAGWFDGETVQCKYHGWRFEPCGGQCVEIPSLTQHETLDPTKIYAGAYPCEERDGYAWVYLPEPGTGRVGDALPAVPELPKFSQRFRSAHLVADLPCNVDHGIIGLMDPAHGPFVHQAWWWRSRASIHEKEKHFEPLNDRENSGRNSGFRMSAHAPSGNSAPYKLLGVYGEPITTTIDFVLPNRRYETIRCGDKWFSSLTTVTPVTPSTCRIDVIAAWNIFYCRSFCDFHRYILRCSVCAAGPADDDRAGRGFAVSSWADADRRRGQAGEVVLRFEAGPVEGKRRASFEWAGYVTLAQLGKPPPPGDRFVKSLFAMGYDFWCLQNRHSMGVMSKTFISKEIARGGRGIFFFLSLYLV